MRYSTVISCILLLIFLVPFKAHAYLGPGLGAGTIGAILGVIGSILLGIFAVIYYPIKRMLKKSGMLKKKNKEKQTADEKDLNQNTANREK